MLPLNTKDPTGQRTREAAAIKALSLRIRKCRSFYQAVIDRLQFNVIRNAASTYEFRTLPSILAQWLADAGAEVDALLLATEAAAPTPDLQEPAAPSPEVKGAKATSTSFNALWFTVGYVAPAYREGALKNRAALAAQSELYRSYRPDARSVLLSDPYRRRLELLAAREFEEMQNLSNRVKSTMAQVLTQGMASGIGPREIAKNLAAQTGIEDRRAERIARTEINFAHNVARLDQAQEARTELGIKSLEMHVSALSPTTRKTHRARHGTLHAVQDQRSWWAKDGNAINCFLPGTMVRGRFVAGSKGEYRGPAIKVVTRGGRNLSVTPNHPVMTDWGLVPAHKIRKGDHLVAYCAQVEFSAGVSDLNYQEGETEIEQVFAALSQVSHPFLAGVGTVDFHGDGVRMGQQVEVVRSDRKLMVGFYPALGEVLDQLALEHSSDRSVNNGSENVESLSQGEDTFPSSVELDEVVEVEVFDFSGRVFDLEEESGLMVANGVITSNCKCSTVTVLVDESGKPLTPGLVAAALAQKGKG